MENFDFFVKKTKLWKTFGTQFQRRTLISKFLYYSEKKDNFLFFCEKSKCLTIFSYYFTLWKLNLNLFFLFVHIHAYDKLSIQKTKIVMHFMYYFFRLLFIYTFYFTCHLWSIISTITNNYIALIQHEYSIL